MGDSQPHLGTYLRKAQDAVPDPYDRIILITDEQCTTASRSARQPVP
jgi:hypothetical protein